MDVYSFGMTVLAMATDATLTDFVGQRWRVFSGAAKVPSPSSIAYNQVGFV